MTPGVRHLEESGWTELPGIGPIRWIHPTLHLGAVNLKQALRIQDRLDQDPSLVRHLTLEASERARLRNAQEALFPTAFI